MITTAQLIDRRTARGHNRAESADLLDELLNDHNGDNLAAALVHQSFATEKQAHQFTAERGRVWIHDGGVVYCTHHAGGYLTAAITAHPRRQIHHTPRGSWQRYDGGDIPCETCAPIHIG